MEIRERIRKFRKEKGFSTHKLSELTGIPQSTISKLENGKRKPDVEFLEKIADALGIFVEKLTGEAVSVIIDERLEEIGMNLEEVAKKAAVSLNWLQNLDNFIPGEMDDTEGPGHELEWDAVIGEYKSYEWITRVAKVIGLPASQLRTALARQEIPAYAGPISSMEEDFADVDFKDAEIFLSGIKSSNIIPISLPTNIVRIPVLGSIPAGMAIEAVQDIIGWEDIPEEWTSGNRQYFGLTVKGDSMYPEYLEGDIVIIRKQPCCESGDDCAVMVNDTDATLKKVHVFEDGIELEAINKMHGKKRFTIDEIESLPVIILGIVVELRRKKK